jgi:purine nucleosidase
MLYALQLDLFGCERFGISVDTGDSRDAGALAVDANAGEISVAMTVNAPAALDLLRQRLIA